MVSGVNSDRINPSCLGDPTMNRRGKKDVREGTAEGTSLIRDNHYA